MTCGELLYHGCVGDKVSHFTERDERKGKEAKPDEDKTDLQSKTGNKFNRQGSQDQKTKEGNQECLPWRVQTMTQRQPREDSPSVRAVIITKISDCGDRGALLHLGPQLFLNHNKCINPHRYMYKWHRYTYTAE